MATDAGGTRPLTALVAGNGQSSVSYQLPAGLLQYVQSVVATVNTASSGDVSPLLTIHDDAGIVVADKQQGDTLDGGGSGRATWALRLTDEGVRTTGFIRYNKKPQTGTYLVVSTSGDVPLTTDGMQFDTGTEGFSVIAGGLMNLESDDTLQLTSDSNDVTVLAGDRFTVDADGQVIIRSVTSATTLRAKSALGITSDTSNVTITASTPTFGLDVHVGHLTATVSGDETHFVTGDFEVDAAAIVLDGPTTLQSGDVEVKLPIGNTLTVFDHLNNPIFRVNENGDLQGKTGKALVFNL